MPEVRHEAVRLVQIAELLMDVDFLLGQLRPDEAERVGRCFQHAVAGRILADRPAGDPRHPAVHADLAGADGFLQGRGRLLLDVLVQLLAALKPLRSSRRNGVGHDLFS